MTHSHMDPGGERVALVQIHVDRGGGRQGGQGRRRAALRGSHADPAGSQRALQCARRDGMQL